MKLKLGNFWEGEEGEEEEKANNADIIDHVERNKKKELSIKFNTVPIKS